MVECHPIESDICVDPLARFGLDPRTTQERLRMTGDTAGLAFFFGQKLAS